jgi:hypothetical protein
VAGISTLAIAGERWFLMASALVLASVHATTRGVALLRGSGEKERTTEDLHILALPWLGRLMLLFVLAEVTRIGKSERQPAPQGGAHVLHFGGSHVRGGGLPMFGCNQGEAVVRGGSGGRSMTPSSTVAPAREIAWKCSWSPTTSISMKL